MTAGIKYDLPEKLFAGQRVVSHTGTRAEIVTTSQHNAFDEPQYRLRFTSGVVGNRLWIRDELAFAGIRLEEGSAE